MDWRYWITYSRTFTIPSDDENVARLAAAELHREAIRDELLIYLPEVEVEPVEGREGE